MQSLRLLALLLAAAPHVATGHTLLRKAEVQPPPEPVGAIPPKSADGAFKTKADACAACKFVATGSCAMYQTCSCHATNAFFGNHGMRQATDQDDWKWACGADGGEKYELCFKTLYREDKAVYLDNFGDEVDPNNPKCPLP